MTTYIQPKQLDFTNFSDEESDEDFVQLPNSSGYRSTGSHPYCGSKVSLDSSDSHNKGGCFEVRKSLEFKKPSNLSPSKSSGSNFDSDTQCDTLDSDSEEEIFTMTEEEFKISQKNYQIIVQRSYTLVREAKESKFRGLSSCMILRNKLFELYSQKELESSPDLFFTEFNFSSEETIRNGCVFESYGTPKQSKRDAKPQRRMKLRYLRN